jgi:hypothetical protein
LRTRNLAVREAGADTIIAKAEECVPGLIVTDVVDFDRRLERGPFKV